MARRSGWRRAGDPVAFFSMTPPHHAVLPVAAPDTIAIDGAFTQPAARGHGIAGRLLQTGPGLNADTGRRPRLRGFRVGQHRSESLLARPRL
ncbi:MAG: hypothetical protein R2838_16680 [Caldilineaceae bacterium]